MKKLIVVADWASDTLTCQEVKSAVEGFLQDPRYPNISFVSSTPSTLHTSYLIRQIVEIEERFGRPLETIVFQNTDTRLHTTNPVEKAKGAELLVIRLKSGMYLLGPNAGYDFSLIKDKIDVVYQYPGLDKGSQFRSRDLYSRVSAHLMDNMEDQLELEETHTNLIPEVTGYHVGHIDNYGNIKTTITEEDITSKYSYGDFIPITLHGVMKKAKLVENLFGGSPGELVMYPGSSGTKDNLYMEISVWRHFTEKDTATGLQEFNNPKPGMEIRFG